jgi:predicted alpha/beta hydrolase
MPAFSLATAKAAMPGKRIEQLIDFPPFRVPGIWFDAPEPRSLLVLIPAMGTAAGYYGPFAKFCAGRGYDVLVPELPGTGDSMPRPSRAVDFGYRDLVDNYVPAVVDTARRKASGLPLVLVGHSLGAHLGMLAMMERKVVIEALVAVAAGNIHYQNWSGAGAGKVRLGAWMAAAMSRLLGHVPGQYFGFGGPQSRSLMREWSRLIRTGSYAHISESVSGRAPAPVLCLGYEGDFLAPERSVARFAEMMGGDYRMLPVTWPGNRHAAWGRHPQATVEFMERWLAERAAATGLSDPVESPSRIHA